MTRTLTKNRRLLKIVSAFLLIGAIAIFAISRSLNYARGPEIDITSPVSGSTIHTPSVKVSGRAIRVNKITLNGNPISMDESGNWNENIVIFSGLNKIAVTGSDQFGRSINKNLDLVGEI